jgi:hypothetical protein
MVGGTAIRRRPLVWRVDWTQLATVVGAGVLHALRVAMPAVVTPVDVAASKLPEGRNAVEVTAKRKWRPAIVDKVAGVVADIAPRSKGTILSLRGNVYLLIRRFNTWWPRGAGTAVPAVPAAPICG